MNVIFAKETSMTTDEVQSKILERYATLGERFIAVVIDLILLAIVTAIILIPFGIVSLISAQLGSPLGWFFGGAQFLWFFLWIVYFTYFESTTGQTIGKRMMSIKVIGENNQHVNLGMVLVRNILRIIDWLPILYLIGFIVIIFTGKKQRIGDLAARTIVIKA